MQNRIRLGVAALAFPFYCLAQQSLNALQPVDYSRVEITDSFWRAKLDKVATGTLPACIFQTETATPRIRNFEKVARKKGEQHEGIFYDDSDVFKAIEAIAYSLHHKPNPQLQAVVDRWIDHIQAAQLADGYLNTWYTLKGLDQRWTDMSMHEDYNGGHLIEAAVAYHQTTGKRKLLDVAIKWADHFMSLFGPNGKPWVTGHQELELALVKLYRTTGNKAYLDEADWLLAQRGRGLAKGYTWTDWKDTAYAQDVKPVKEQSEITGHAVRAMYMYTGAADVANYKNDDGYYDAMQRVWEDVVHRNMYVTGGIGSSGSNEGFGKDYELPNEQAYCETCASVGMVFWNQRMHLRSADASYYHVLERSLYNAALDGISFSGDRFFYGNPLASDGRHNRREWFGTACCPANIARLLSSLGSYIYSASANDLFVNLFAGSKTQLQLGGTNVDIVQSTGYPWQGQTSVEINPQKAALFALRLRLPYWLANTAVPGNLYFIRNQPPSTYQLLVNGKPAQAELKQGYLVINRTWKKGDVVSFRFDMPVMQLQSSPEVKANEDRVAFQRGPLVYCVEGADNNKQAWNFIVNAAQSVGLSYTTIQNEPVVALQIPATVFTIAGNADRIEQQTKSVTAIPYYCWNNRGANEMQVWLPTKLTLLRLNR